MTQFNMYEAKTNLSKISKLLEDGKEDVIIISRNGKPVLKVTLYESDTRQNLFGCAKGMFNTPDNFDDIDITEDFAGDIFPRWNTY